MTSKRLSHIIVGIVLLVPLSQGPYAQEASMKGQTVHDVAITDISVPSTCKQGETVPVTVSTAYQGTRREAFRVMLSEDISGKEIASQQVVLAKVWKDDSKDVADLTLDPPVSCQGNFGWGINIDGDINRDGYADLLILDW